MAKVSLPENEKQLMEATSSLVTKRLRDIVQPPGQKGSWMQLLNDKQLLEVYYELRKGTPVNRIVVKAQSTWNIKPTSKAGSLARSLRKFRDSIVGEIFAVDLDTDKKKKEAEELSKRGKKIAQEIDVMQEMAWVIQVQIDRIKLLHTKEKASIPFKSTDKSIQVLKELLDSYHNMQVKLGLVDSKAPQLNLNVSAKFKELMDTTVQDDGENMANAFMKAVETAEKAAIPLFQKPDGSWGSTNPEEQN